MKPSLAWPSGPPWISISTGRLPVKRAGGRFSRPEMRAAVEAGPAHDLLVGEAASCPRPAARTARVHCSTRPLAGVERVDLARPLRAVDDERQLGRAAVEAARADAARRQARQRAVPSASRASNRRSSSRPSTLTCSREQRPSSLSVPPPTSHGMCARERLRAAASAKRTASARGTRRRGRWRRTGPAVALKSPAKCVAFSAARPAPAAAAALAAGQVEQPHLRLGGREVARQRHLPVVARDAAAEPAAARAVRRRLRRALGLQRVEQPQGRS